MRIPRTSVRMKHTEEQTMITHITPENFEAEITKSDIPVLVDFWAPWCGPCQMMAPVFDELSTEYEGKLKFVKVNTEDHPELAGRFGVSGIPNLKFFKDGKPVADIVGFAPKDIMKQKINATLSNI